MELKIECQYDNRKKCDSLYIEKYNKLVKKVNKAIEYTKTHSSGIAIRNDFGICNEIIAVVPSKELLEILQGK